MIRTRKPREDLARAHAGGAYAAVVLVTMSATTSPSDLSVGSAPRERADIALPVALAESATYAGHPIVQVHETHASWVFLAGEYAYKVKKPVRMAFLDYSTLSRRHAACREEVRVNSELAPEMYLDVQAIVGTPNGYRFTVEGTPDAVEYAVRMRRFDEAQTLLGAITARSLTRAQVRAVASRLASFHDRARIVEGGGPGEVLAAWQTNLDELAGLPAPRRVPLAQLRRFGEAFVASHASELVRRARGGYVRDGHGDLRCEHVLLGGAGGEPVRVVDRIEFDPALRHVDVACDLAFLAMDIEAHRRRWAARELVSAYRHAGGSPGSEELRCFYGAHWALVRAKVSLLAASTLSARRARAERQRAEQLCELAQHMCWRARRPLVMVVCGVAASGKSTLAAELARRSELPVVSSDAVRKRRAGLAPNERAAPEQYTREFTRATYEQLSRDALAQLDRKGGVIVDASARRRSQRALLLRRLDARTATLLVVHCRVSPETALARASARMHDRERVSDATPEIVSSQLHDFQALEELSMDSVLELDGELSIEAQADAVTRAVDERVVRAFPQAIGAFSRSPASAHAPSVKL